MRTETLENPRSARVDEAGTRSAPRADDRNLSSRRSAGRKAMDSVEGVGASTEARPHRIMPYKSGKANHRLNYKLKVEIGLIMSLLLLLGLTNSPIYKREKAMEIVLTEQQTIQIEDIQQTKQEMPPPPPPRPQIPIAVADNTILEDDVLNLDVTLDLEEPVADLPPPPPAPKEKVEEVEQEIFVIVEDMPEMIGGIQALMNEIKYPALARQAGIEGRVIVQMVVDETGKPKDIVILRGIGGGCDEEAIRAVSLMKFKPGKQRGRPVPVRYSVSVQFRLKDIEDR